jgi:hypothetical protein
MPGLAYVKSILCRFMLLHEFCKCCGRRVDVVWETSDELWREVVGDPGTVRCIECFDREARTTGTLLRWIPILDERIPRD